MFKRFLNVSSFFVLPLALLLVTGCLVPSSPPSNYQAPLTNDLQVMRDYGQVVRRSYREKNPALLRSDEFRRLEKIVEKGGKVGPAEYREIEKGIIYVGMPMDQAMASLDDLVEVDLLSINESLIVSYRGAAVSLNSSSIIGRLVLSRRVTVISCNDTVVGFFIHGHITPETQRATFGSGKLRFQTNFAAGFWTDESTIEARRLGSSILSGPRTYADRREHRWSLFSNNSGEFEKPSTYWQRHQHGNNMMAQHLRRGGKVC